MIPVNRPLIAKEDLDAVSSALSNTFISGETMPVVNFEKKLAQEVGTEFAVAVSTGTSAIDLTIEALEILPSEHCIVPNFTIVSTVSNLLRKTQNIEFVDADPVTWSIDSASAVSAATSNTRLILPVHIYGLPADMDPIIEVAKDLNIFVLEDAAEALGLNYKDRKCGSIGGAGVFSFFANKIVTGGEGGAITTNSSDLVVKLKSLRNLAHSSERFVHDKLAWNMRMPGLSAALIESQLSRLASLVEKKRQIADYYIRGLDGHPWFSIMVSEVDYASNVYWVVPILLNKESPVNAAELQRILRENDVDSRRFFCPMHLQPALAGHPDFEKKKFPVSENLWRNGLYLPSGLGNTLEEIEIVISVLWKVANEYF